MSAFNMEGYCKKCGIEIASISKEKLLKFSRNHCSRSCSNSRTVNEETKKKKSLRFIGLKKPLEERKLYFRTCKVCNKFESGIRGTLIGGPNACSKECYRIFFRERLLNRKYNPRRMTKFKTGFYGGVWMQSSWEMKTAKYLDLLGINWKREDSLKLKYTKTDGKLHHYHPDFYLPKYNLYLEIKGRWLEEDVKKMEMVEKQNDVKFAYIHDAEEIESVIDDIVFATP